jgi:hypothetical protein
VTAYADRVEDGDLVVVDADAGALLILGQQPDTLALNDELQRLADSARALAEARTEPELLVQRGAMLRARHQLERLLGRVEDPVLARHAAAELLVGEAGGHTAVQATDKTRLVAVLCANEPVAETARATVREVRRHLARRVAAAYTHAVRLIPSAADPAEVLALRLDLIRLRHLLENVDSILRGADPVTPSDALTDAAAVDVLARARLGALRDVTSSDLASEVIAGERVRHAVRQVRRLNRLLDDEDRVPDPAAAVERRLGDADVAALERAAGALTVWPADGGAELRPFVGGKAANLAEAVRFVDRKLIAPWFVVTDRAFREILSRPVPGDARFPSLAVLIADTLVRREWPDDQKAASIRRAWEAMELPDDLVAALTSAYRTLAEAEPSGAAAEVPDDDPRQPFVAVRSSALEEDAEAEARPGEFDTFLFVRGEGALRDRVKQAWAGLWNERAIHNRAALRSTAEVGGGIIVQRMVWARASGVLQTVNLASGQWREMVVNAGLGIGEGIVSGAVAADLIVVSKDGPLETGPLEFRYITNDKRERVVFDRGLGSGTRRVETLYHQRLRPALEYVELCELVRAAARLEAAFRQPLDIEFALEGQCLRLLQVRPVPAAWTAWRDTIERHPLAGRLS